MAVRATHTLKVAIITSLAILEFIFPVIVSTAEAPKPPLEVTQTSVCDDYRREVGKYDWDVETALKIMNLESGCKNIHNYNDTHKHYRTGEIICKGSYGPMQVGCIHYKDEDKEDWKKNIELAYRVYQQANGFTPWSTYSKI